MNWRLMGWYFSIICISLQLAACRKVSHAKKDADDRSSPDDELGDIDTSRNDESEDTNGVTRDTDTAGDREFTVEEYVDFGRAMCDFYDRCNSSLLSEFKEGTFAECLESFECDAEWVTGLSKFLAPQFSMQECATIIEKADCTEIGPEYPQLLCSPVPVEILAEGEPCSLQPYSSDAAPKVCGSGTHCAVSLVNEPENPGCGVCRHYRSLHEKCDNQEEECGTGLYCSFDFQCEREKEQGEPCSWFEECSSKLCNLDGLCVKWGDVGDDCDNNVMQTCNTELNCVDGKCVSPLADLGETCSPAHFCRSGLECIKGRCEENRCELRNIGEPCCSNTLTGCVINARCSPNTFTCVPVGMPGEACAADIDCADWLFCDPKTTTCKLPKFDGEPCTGPRECRSLYCDKDKGVCAQLYQC